MLPPSDDADLGVQPPDTGGPVRFLVRYFIRGLLLVVPVGATAWILIYAFNTISGLVELSSDGEMQIPLTDVHISAGSFAWKAFSFVFILAVVVGIGLLTSNVVTQWVLRRLEEVVFRVPVVKLIYTSIRDMVEAFVSDKKKFDKPVLLSFAADPEVEVIGFITRSDLEEFGRPGKVAVYVPQSYNFAANLILVRKERVTPIDLPPGDVMAFVVSGGVSQATVEPKGDGSVPGTVLLEPYSRSLRRQLRAQLLRERRELVLEALDALLEGFDARRLGRCSGRRGRSRRSRGAQGPGLPGAFDGVRVRRDRLCVATRARARERRNAADEPAIDQRLEVRLEQLERLDRRHAIDPRAQVAARLRSAHHQLGEDRRLGRVDVEHLLQVVAEALDAARGRVHASRESGDDQLVELHLDLGLRKLQHRVAVRLLVAAGGGRVERKRVLIRGGQLLLDQHPEDARFVRFEAGEVGHRAGVGELTCSRLMGGRDIPISRARSATVGRRSVHARGTIGMHRLA